MSVKKTLKKTLRGEGIAPLIATREALPVRDEPTLRGEGIALSLQRERHCPHTHHHFATYQIPRYPRVQYCLRAARCTS